MPPSGCSSLCTICALRLRLCCAGSLMAWPRCSPSSSSRCCSRSASDAPKLIHHLPSRWSYMLDMTSDAMLVPSYLRDVYSWAYLTPRLAGWLDRQIVVQAILWGNAQRLIGDVLA